MRGIIVYIVAVALALALAVSTGNFFAWWLLVSIVVSPVFVGLCHVSADADVRLGHKS